MKIIFILFLLISGLMIAEIFIPVLFKMIIVIIGLLFLAIKNEELYG